MANEIALFSNFGLATPARITYSPSQNVFVGNAWTSCTGRTYCNTMRLGHGMLIKEDVGSNSWGTYLNAVRIYDTATKKLLCEKIYPMYQGAHYSKYTVKCVVTRLLENLLLSSAKEQHMYLDENRVRRELAAQIDYAFSANQMEVLHSELKALGY